MTELTKIEIDKIQAETAKLNAETKSLAVSGWKKPSAWLPTLAALAAIASAVGQYQYSSIKQEKVAVEAEKKATIARKEEIFLLENNAKLQEENRKLNENNEKLENNTQLLSKSLETQAKDSINDIVTIKQELDNANADLRTITGKVIEDTIEVSGKVKNEILEIEEKIKERNEVVESIVESAKERNTESQNLVEQLNDRFKATRSASMIELTNNHKSDPEAIKSALNKLLPPQVNNLSANGRFNVIYFLRKTDISVWDEKMKEQGKEIIKEIRKREKSKKGVIGPKTKSQLNLLENFLK